MRKLILYLLAAFCMCGCYEDKGNYDYRTLEEVEISLPEKSYGLMFGEKLEITPSVTTAIPENDLRYYWEFYLDTIGKSWKQYVSVYEGKVMDYVFEQDEKFFKAEGTYNLRMRVEQLSNGRNFYSEIVPVALTAVPSMLGAMVLHGNGTATDIGLIVADEFSLAAPEHALASKVVAHYYSESNGGEKIAGRGKSVVQTYLSNDMRYADNTVVVAITEGGAAVTNSKTFKNEGEWNDLFLGGLNQNKPQCLVIQNGNTLYAMDGGDIFGRNDKKYFFVVPSFVAADFNYDFYPYIWCPNDGRQGLFFDRKTQGFIELGQMNIMVPFGEYPEFRRIDALAGGPVAGLAFNPGKMQADLVYMDRGGQMEDGFLAVMKKEDGSYFLAELDMGATDDVGVARFRYDFPAMSGEPVGWAFGSQHMNMCYCATAGKVYQFAAESGNAITLQELKMADNSPVAFDGRISLIKILKPEMEFTYHKSNIQMVVGTYGETAGTGKLYSLELDQFSGRVKSVNIYEGFDEIYDVNIKGY